MVDADYKFTYVDIGCQGRISDLGVFKNCELYKLLASYQANIPPPSPVNALSDLNDSFLLESNNEANIPYVIIADDAFLLTTYSMKPYSQKNLSESRRIFNYRLSQARRTSENTFGMLSNQFHVLSTRIHLKLEIASKVDMTCCLLHNLLRVRSKDTYTPQGFADEISEDGNVRNGAWRNENFAPCIQPLLISASRHASAESEEIRALLKDYFMGRGQVPWEWKHIKASHRT